MRFPCLFFLFLLCFSAQGQNLKSIHSNTSLIKNYSPKTYKANPQIFSILQDKRGVMYFANQLGVVEYDGETWNLIRTEGKQVLKLAKNKNDQIYVLCEGDFGILTPNDKGELIFQSKLGLFKTTNNSFLTFKNILFDKDKIYIRTSKGLFTLHKNKIIRSSTDFDKVNFIKKIDNIVYIQINDKGLHQLDNGIIIKIPQGNLFKNYSIVDIIKFKNNTYIITQENGIFKMSTNKEIKIQTLLKGNVITSSENNRDIYLILGTSNRILILDTNLNIYKKIGIQEGLSDATIKDVFLDKQNNLWIGSQNGISKVEIDTPIEIFNKKNALNGSIEDVEKFNNTIFCSTQNGVYYINEKGNAIKIKGISSDCYGLSTIKVGNDSVLLVAEVNHVYQINNNFQAKKISDGGPYMFKKSPLNNREIFTIHYNGLSNFKYENGALIEQNYITNFSEGEPYNFIIQSDGTIWIGTLNDGIYKTTVNTFTDSSSYIHYDSNNGLPEGQCFLFEHEKTIYTGTDLGLYKFENNAFKHSNDLSFGSNKNMKGIHRISKDKSGNIWAVLFDEKNNYEIGYSKLIENSYKWFHNDFIKHSDEIVHGFYHSKNGNTWLGGPNGLIKFNSNYLKKDVQNFNCLLRKVSLKDSLLFGGSFNHENEKIIQVNYSGNTPITFEYAAPTFIDERKTVFSFYLEGYDDTWSDWTSRTLKEYNLDEGAYTFHVKAKNILGVESTISSHSIIVSPPWYRTIVAIISYVILFILLIYALMKLSVKRVAKLNKKLEDTVLSRTKEIESQKEEAEKQRDVISEKNQEILDSMTYAKRIQNAILPPSKLVEEYLQESFILYKPKDIVAGDFYWLNKKEKTILFAAADCTGHGVPGAMVSVVCNNGLNRSIREFGLTDPGKILTKTREIVIQEFGKSDEDVKDGMDIALCSLERNTLKYAGANNPLWIIRNNEIIETKANKQPIGQFDNPIPYSTHSFQVEKGDAIYIFSDGYVDQFGGPKGKKFKARAFRELLLSIQEKSMTEQNVIIDKTFETWKGDLEQIDDVCVIGVKV